MTLIFLNLKGVPADHERVQSGAQPMLLETHQENR